MRSSIRLDSAVFQLTPTRTRCDLVLSANGKTEKLASGLLNPFLAHLKAAQEQMAKGGYSIILEPEPGSDASWFTKGTVERFVRFVSTPEVLERVYTLESEILQIEEAIVIQGNSEMVLSAVEESPVKPMETLEGNRASPDTSDEKAIVLYKPGTNPPESNGSTSQGGNSKVQLLKVLETRRTVLRKEQGMAFARAVAAGFDIDNISSLVSFSDCFGASRLRDACKRFKELWKKKHETGQWVEIEATEELSNRSDFSAMNASGIMLSSVANAELSSESNGKPSGLASADEKSSSEHQPPPGHPEYFQGQFPHQMFPPPWPLQSPPGTAPFFSPYPMQGMPYYQNFSGTGPFFPPPYAAAVDDPRLNPGLRMGQKRHSMDSSNGNTEPEAWEMEAHRTRSLDEAEFEKESRKRSSRSGKNKSGVVVIRNINYITSKGQTRSDEESQSGSESEADKEDGSGSSETKHNNSLKSSKKKENRTDLEDNMYSVNTEADGGHWEAFQNFLLRDADDEKRSSNQGMFSTENKAHSKRRQSKVNGDPILFGGQDAGESQNGRMDMQNASGNTTRMRRTSADESIISRKNGSNGALDGQGDILSSEINGRRLGYRRSSNDDFAIDRESGYTDSDPMDVNGFDGMRNNADRKSSNTINDDSYIVSLRSTSGGNGNRNAVDMDSEFPSANRNAENRAGNQVNYEPEELSMMPQRGAENGAMGYDPALDYEMEDGASRNKKNKESATEAKQGSKKLPDKGQRSKLLPDDKKKNVGPIRRGKPSKLSPLEEARARAEKMRTFKADLLKMKKEKEEADMKRLEALKMERQKRIAARGGSTIPAPSTRKQVPTRTSSSSLRGSKFSDSGPGSTSPLQRFPARTASVGSIDSQKASKTSRLSGGALSAGNRLSRSATSLPALKRESNSVASETKTASMARIRRLSEPKISSHPISSLREKSTDPVSKPKASSDGPEVKKLSAIVNHDMSKAATLPELKIRTSKGTAKEASQKSNSVKPSTSSGGVEAKKNDGKFLRRGESDENPIVEKTVVMLEEKPSAPRAENKQNDSFKIKENPTGVSDHSTIQAPASKITTDIFGAEPTEAQINKQNTIYEVASSDVKKSLPQASSIDVAEKSFEAPYARSSSFEDPCTQNSEYGKAAPTDLEPVNTSSTSVKAQVFDSRSLKLEKIPEVSEKVKESSKGFRRLLKFGRKSNGSGAGEHNAESDNVSFNGSDADDNGTNTVASGEVHTLKNLISQDETPTAEATTHKSSRHFSLLLLSPFRSKTSEKKPAA